MNYAYILRCNDGTLYTGWTNDLNRRVHAHNSGTGCKYTRTRTPVELAYYEKFEDKRDARRREYAIKKLPKREKERLIESRKEAQAVYFEYGSTEIEYLKHKDKRLGEAIDAIGHGKDS
ncbi:MAG: GIY-YIG nuclease family protein [Synergistaceae bacterium]|jgi:putative endonuclease|nr:GIY-YIG nuclease family protein [Synergistaceae bacterium]